VFADDTVPGGFDGVVSVDVSSGDRTEVMPHTAPVVQAGITGGFDGRWLMWEETDNDTLSSWRILVWNSQTSGPARAIASNAVDANQNAVEGPLPFAALAHATVAWAQAGTSGVIEMHVTDLESGRDVIVNTSAGQSQPVIAWPLLLWNDAPTPGTSVLHAYNLETNQTAPIPPGLEQSTGASFVGADEARVAWIEGQHTVKVWTSATGSVQTIYQADALDYAEFPVLSHRLVFWTASQRTWAADLATLTVTQISDQPVGPHASGSHVVFPKVDASQKVDSPPSTAVVFDDSGLSELPRCA
jgi:hypothetical protein